MTIYPAIKGSNSRELLLWLLGRRWRLRVSGLSMLPTLDAGEELLVDRQAYREQLPQIGDVIVVRNPREPARVMLKRVADIRPNQQLYILGDNPDHSTDSRTFGAVSTTDLLGKVVCKFQSDSSYENTSLAALVLATVAALWLYRQRTR